MLRQWLRALPMLKQNASGSTTFSSRIEKGEVLHVTPGDDGTSTLARYDQRDSWDEWTDRDGVVHEVPNGIDPGWDYNIGEAAYGRQLSAEAMAAWQKAQT